MAAIVSVEKYQTKREEMFRIRIDPGDGSPRYSDKETFFSKKLAYEKRREISDLLASGKKTKERKKFVPRFQDYLAALDKRIRAGDPRMKKSTKRIIESSFKDILPLPRFKESFVDEHDTQCLNEFQIELLDNHNAGGVNRIMVDLRTYLNWCVKMGDIDKSPMKGVKFFVSEFKGYFFSRKEMALIYKHARISEAGACGGPTERLWWAIYVLKETGMRIGEFLNIRESDLRENAVWVTGKTGKRLVPLPNVVQHTLIKILKNPWSYSGIERAWRTMILKTGILNPSSIDSETGLPQPPTIHDLRHTFASTYLAKGNSPANLKKIGGWKTLASLEKYAHPDIPNLLNTMRRRVRR